MANKARLILIGASGHGRVTADIAFLNGYEDIVFLDDSKTGECADSPIVGVSSDLAGMEGDVFVSIGSPGIRRRLMDMYPERRFPVLLHPQSVVAKGVPIGEGSVVMAGAVVNPGSVLGRGVIVNTCASIDHDCVIEDFVHVAVGAHLCGSIRVGRDTWIGAGAIVNNNVNICSGCTIGAGATVIRDITVPGTYVGSPVRMIKKAKQQDLPE